MLYTRPYFEDLAWQASNEEDKKGTATTSYVEKSLVRKVNI